MLTGEAVAWFQKEHLPTPGASGIFCASLHAFGGDSAQLASRLSGQGSDPPPSDRKPPRLGQISYFKGASPSNPLVLPSASRDVLAKFPPTLFISGTRSAEMSAALRSQIELTLLGVEAMVSIWDGMMHAFFFDPDLPESREAYRVIADFFNSHLAGEPAPQQPESP